MTQKQADPKKVADLLEESHANIINKTNRLNDILTNLRYEGKSSLGRNLKEAREILNCFNQELLPHIKLEDETLFPFLETYIPKLESVIHLLKAEHEDFKMNLRSFEFSLKEIARDNSDPKRAKTIEKIREKGIYLIYLLRNHIQAESESVYKLIDQELRPSEKKELEKRLSKTTNPSLRKRHRNDLGSRDGTPGRRTSLRRLVKCGGMRFTNVIGGPGFRTS